MDLVILDSPSLTPSSLTPHDADLDFALWILTLTDNSTLDSGFWILSN